MQQTIRHDISLLSEDDLYLFNEGRHLKIYARLGAHPHQADGVAGTYFATWAPNAHLVSVVGHFNGWMPGAHPLAHRGQSGVWEGFIPGVGKGEIYKFHVESRHHAYRADKADPYGFWHEVPPRSGSVVWELDYQWGDDEWMATRRAHNRLEAPISIYEIHLGSWRRNTEADRPLTYRELAEPLAEHVTRLGF
ncbi:MAG TPA: 1,4-alpha-glucan branching enzyme, partial [Chloroflexota bacterium]